MSLLLLLGGGATPVNRAAWTEEDDTWSLSGDQRIPRTVSDRRELLWTHDLDGFQSGAIGHDFLELWHDERLDLSEQLGFGIPADHNKAYLLAVDLDVVTRGRRFFVTEHETERSGTETTIRVEADAAWYRLGDIVRPGSIVLTTVTPRAGLQLILRLSGWTQGPATTSSADEFSMEQQDKTVLQLLRTWAKITGRYLVFNTAERSVDLADTRGADLGLAFRYGRNLRGARRRTKPPELTVLYPYGADGLTIAGINGGLEYLEDFTYYTDQGVDLDDVGPDGLTNRQRYTRSRVWSDSSFLVDTDLLAAATARLALLAQPIKTYELDVIDLSEVTGSIEDVRPGDRVRVFDPDFDDDVAATVTRFRRYRQEPWKNKIELSTILNPLTDANESGSRGSVAEDWHQFVGPISADYVIRNDGDYITSRIPLAFRSGGRANFHLDLNAVGVGDGTMHVEVVDAADADAPQFYELDVPYLDGEPVRALLHWATEDLLGSYDFRVRVTTVADGGPSPTNGIDIVADAAGEASFWILAQGAIQETPTSPNVARYEYTGAVQSFTVPDNVTEISVEAAGARGGDAGGPGAHEGDGATVSATFVVIPGTVYDVYVGGEGGTSEAGIAGWPNGGASSITGVNGGGGGGGSTDVRPQGSDLASALIVAGAGGGQGGTFSPDTSGGDGGFIAGADATTTTGGSHGRGATQYAGGAAGAGAALGQPGTFGQGGNGVSANAFSKAGGGGGGGWYGGGGGSRDSAGSGENGGGGGGGSGLVSSEGFDLILADGSNPGHGYVEIRWETPA